MNEHQTPANQTHVCAICVMRLATDKMLDGHLKTHYDQPMGRLKGTDEDFYAGLWQPAMNEVDWAGLFEIGDPQVVDMAELEHVRAASSGPRASQIDQAGNGNQGAENIERWLEALTDEFQPGIAGSLPAFQANSRPPGQERQQ